ncbi:MAG: hypothetical protein ACXWKC_10260 [Xanthobacteraceae bacterium]
MFLDRAIAACGCAMNAAGVARRFHSVIIMVLMQRSFRLVLTDAAAQD